jgi:hypothetical protein
MSKEEKARQARDIFSNVVFELHKDDAHYDQMHFSFMKIYDTHAKKVPKFYKIDTVTQYCICESTYCMSEAAALKGIREAFVFSKPEKSKFEKQYSIVEGFEAPKILELKSMLLLRNNA